MISGLAFSRWGSLLSLQQISSMADSNRDLAPANSLATPKVQTERIYFNLGDSHPVLEGHVLKKNPWGSKIATGETNTRKSYSGSHTQEKPAGLLLSLNKNVRMWM